MLSNGDGVGRFRANGIATEIGLEVMSFFSSHLPMHFLGFTCKILLSVWRSAGSRVSARVVALVATADSLA
jgi:hypothetical protein